MSNIYQTPTETWHPQTPNTELKNSQVECAYCGHEIKIEEEYPNSTSVLEIFEGSLGVGPKSGQPMVVSNPLVEKVKYTTNIVHIECAIPFIRENIFDDGVPDFEDLPLCAMCEGELMGPLACPNCHAEIIP